MIGEQVKSVEEAARELGASPRRVRALLASGSLRGEKIGGVWVVDPASVLLRSERPGAQGRPLSPLNAWGVLFLASGLAAPWLARSSGARLRRALSFQGLAWLIPRALGRAKVHRFACHPGELRHLLSDPIAMHGGLSAAAEHGFGLLPGDAADLYVPAKRLSALMEQHALSPAPPSDANVLLRAVQHDAWRWVAKPGHSVPKAVAIADLIDWPDPRAHRVATRQLSIVDRALRKRRG